MTTYLITWNPNKWPWATLADDINICHNQGFLEDRWSCGNSRKIMVGDRVFLLRQGREPRGIVGSGYASSDVYQAEHWDEDHPTGIANYVDIRFDVILDAEQGHAFAREALNNPIFSGVHWNTQMSGINIPDPIAETLEIEWARHLAGLYIVQERAVQGAIRLPEETIFGQVLYEGATETITVIRHERNIEARRQCIRHYGLNCMACGFNFQAAYGNIGIDFIHIHHLVPISQMSESYEIDPIEDLRPICANCHAMIHKRNPPFTIEELQDIIASNR